MKTVQAASAKKRKAPAPNALRKDSVFKRFKKTFFLFLLFVPALVYYIMFKYVPMWGISLSFYKYSIFKGLAGSKFIGLKNFQVFFESPSFWNITMNTLILGVQSLLVTFPLTVLFALMLNEIRSIRFKKITQTVSYLPHFLSTVVVCSLATSLLDPTQGAINTIIKLLGGDPIYFIMESKGFRPIYLITEVWQGLGWGTIVYLAAISAVDPGMYEAARLDGAGRLRQIWSITLPSIAPTVSTMFILKVGHIMDASMEKVLLLQQPITFDVSQVLSTYVYEIGLQKNDYALSTAAGLYTSLVNLVLLVTFNWISEKISDTGIF